jgi:hypothetical protein
MFQEEKREKGETRACTRKKRKRNPIGEPTREIEERR